MTTVRTRLAPSDRKATILEAALVCAGTAPYNTITREAIGLQAGCAPGTVSHYFSTMTKLRRAVMREAVSRGIVAIVADGLAQRDPQAAKAAPETLKAARAALATR